MRLVVDPDDRLKAFVRAHASRAPLPPPGHVERVAAAMRDRRARLQERCWTLGLGFGAAAMTACLLLPLAVGERRSDAERIVAESFASVTESPAESDDPRYEAWTP